MKLIYTLTLLLFSSSVFADFLYVKSSISDLLDYGFRIKQIDTMRIRAYVYHLRTDDEDVAICYYWDGAESCIVDTQDKKLIEIINALEKSNEN